MEEIRGPPGHPCLRALPSLRPGLLGNPSLICVACEARQARIQTLACRPSHTADDNGVQGRSLSSADWTRTRA